VSNKESIELFHDYGVCYETKTIKCFGEINKERRDQVISNLHLLDQKTGEVTILLSSEGGCVQSGLEIIDAIRAMKNLVRIIAYGEVSSMASVIMQAGDRRCMMPNSFLMLHEGEAELKGKRKDRKEWGKLQEHQEKVTIDLYYDRIKEKKPRYGKKKFIDKVEDKDWILLPKEAVELGLADEILETY